MSQFIKYNLFLYINPSHGISSKIVSVTTDIKICAKLDIKEIQYTCHEFFKLFALLIPIAQLLSRKIWLTIRSKIVNGHFINKIFFV